MTAKEKAKELVGKFYGLLPQWVNMDDAKLCASIASDEILNSRSVITESQVEYNEYWQHVKKEIEAL
jgi:hypothetical protein